MRGLKSVCLTALILMLVACAKPVPPEKASYVGQWNAPNMSLLILQEGKVIYERKEIKDGVTLTKKLDSPIKEFHGNDFEVGIASITTTFVVSQTPHQVDGKWKMVVDDVELTKQE